MQLEAVHVAVIIYTFQAIDNRIMGPQNAFINAFTHILIETALQAHTNIQTQ